MCDKKQPWIPITNDFMFCRVMSKKEICRGVLKAILPEISVGEIIYPRAQYSIDAYPDARGVRLDVYTEDGKRVYNIEMQCARVNDLARRSRYYLGRIDGELLDKGQAYATLRESYVIFICTFDPFGRHFRRYHFENRCLEDLNLPLADGTHKIFVNVGGNVGTANPDLEILLAYFKNAGTEKQSALTQAINHEVDIANRDADWRRKMLTLEMKMNDYRNIGRQEGRIEGRIEGRKEGRTEYQLVTAKRMLTEKCDLSFIAKITGLSEPEILKLKN